MAFNEFVTLNSVLSDLPEIESFKPQFMYGTKLDMHRWIRQRRKDGNPYYPIVWLQTPFRLSGKPFAKGDVNIILANLASENASNIERTNNNFVKYLDPLLDSVLKALRTYSGIRINETDDFDVMRHFNYDTDDEHESTDVWDAITLKTEIEFNLKCL